MRSISGADFISLELVDPEKYKARLSPVKRSLAKTNRALGFADFNLNLSGIGADTDQVLELVLKRSALAR